ncbi:dUTP diphosphatase [Arachnia propionica]|uniref:dUTP diphosphatase n=1 Tax=Arachnia propionica TaxID=1750 RepID=UPI0021AB5CFD|nr:dUTP diphosphatase [Arachnia propionica]MDO5083736.1 dUTP diphosphatase [Arachnia propionica]
MQEIPVVLDDPDHLPRQARPGDAGADLRAAHRVTLAPGERTLVGTGVRVALPEGTFGMVTPRSGMAARAGLGIVNSPGIIDAGYRGEIKVCLINHDPRQVIDIAAGERIAQLVVVPFLRAEFVITHALDATVRGEDGYGSTGNA